MENPRNAHFFGVYMGLSIKGPPFFKGPKPFFPVDWKRCRGQIGFSSKS